MSEWHEQRDARKTKINTYQLCGYAGSELRHAVIVALGLIDRCLRARGSTSVSNDNDQ